MQNSIQNNHISHYLACRIKQNQSWYLAKNHLKQGFDLNHRDKNVFYVLYLTVFYALEDGNTVVILKEEHSPYHQISHWQYVLLEPIFNFINDNLANLLNFNLIFEQIDALKDNAQALIDFIDKQQMVLADLYQQSQIINPVATEKLNTLQTSNHIKNLSEKLLWVMRFYFYSRHKLKNSLSTFMQSLHEHGLLAYAGDKAVDKPLIFYSNHQQSYLWLNRSYHAERHLLMAIDRICSKTVQPIDDYQLHDGLNDEQKQAVIKAIWQPLSIITGGPGTGKTFTVAQIVMTLYIQKSSEGLALVAPTGKAAQRMQESLQKSLADKPINLPSPMTIHRLLGIGMAGIARYHRDNPLPYELIIVDEASMLGVELAMALLSAVKEGARLILLGDIHQLSAVEAGSVLADLCQLKRLHQAKTQLIQSRRFDENSGVGRLAKLINQPEVQNVQAVLTLINNYHQELSFIDIGQIKSSPNHTFYVQLLAPYQKSQGYFWQTKQLKSTFYRLKTDEKHAQVQKLTEIFNQYRILTASHLSVCGDEAINTYIQLKHREYLKLSGNQSMWYHGRPIMVQKNRYDLGLFNGDIGICLQSGHRAHQLSVYFAGDTIKAYPVGMLDGHVATSAYAITVHKSQGSEFDEVAVTFDDDNQRLLSKELIYTAITRAKQQVKIYSTRSALSLAINHKTMRQTGLTVDIPY